MSELIQTTETAENSVIEATETTDTDKEHPVWHKQVAFTTMLMALLAALGAMLAGISSHQALLYRTEEIIEMSRLESDRLYIETLKTKHEIMAGLGVTPDAAEVRQITTFEEEIQALEAGVTPDYTLSITISQAHVTFAITVTLLSVGITLGGMAVVVERKWLWAAGLLGGIAGVIGLVLGIARMLF